VLQISSVRQRLTLGVLAATLAAPSLLAAQNKFSVTPWVGSYYAFSKFYNNDLSNGLRVQVNQSNTAMFGIRLTVPVSPTIAAEGSFGYASSPVNFRIKNGVVDSAGNTFDVSTDFKGNVLVGSVRALFRPRRSNLSLILGAILVNHGGKAWQDSTITKKTSFGGVVGIGLRANVTPRFPIDIRGELNLYSFNPDKSNDTANGFYPSTFQQDLVVSIGIPLGSR
jgi:hypothetical protein